MTGALSSALLVMPRRIGPEVATAAVAMNSRRFIGCELPWWVRQAGERQRHEVYAPEKADANVQCETTRTEFESQVRQTSSLPQGRELDESIFLGGCRDVEKLQHPGIARVAAPGQFL